MVEPDADSSAPTALRAALLCAETAATCCDAAAAEDDELELEVEVEDGPVVEVGSEDEEEAELEVATEDGAALIPSALSGFLIRDFDGG